MSYELQGLVPGERELVIEWLGARHQENLFPNFSTLIWQVRLYEGTNQIEFHHGSASTSGPIPPIMSASIGIENHSGSRNRGQCQSSQR